MSNQNNQASSKSLIKAAFAGMIATSVIASTCAFAQTAPEKASCKSAMVSEKTSCKAAMGGKTKKMNKMEKSSCKSASGCKTIGHKNSKDNMYTK